MKFSLKTLLFVLIAVGVVAGVLGRLCFSHPQIFLGLVGALVTLGPFLLAIGTVIWLGIRGRGAWSMPTCSKCKHDLRRIAPDQVAACPGCGEDLAKPHAVHFVREKKRRWGLIVWGLVLLVVPFMGFGFVSLVSMYVGTSPSNLRNQSTRQLVQQQLPNRVDEPWVWNELNSRLSAGSLSQQEVDDAVKQLIAHMKKTNPDGYDSPLSWQDDFLKSANQAGLISEPVFIDLCDAFHGPKPIIQPLPRIREDSQRLEVRVDYGNTWGAHSGLGAELVWAVGRVLVDGKSVEFRQNHKHGQTWSGTHEGSLAAGEHEVSVEVESAYIDEGKLLGLDTNDLPANRWPKARKRWKQTVTAPLKVYSQEETIVPLTTDPSRNPARTAGIQVERCVVQAGQDEKKKIIVKFKFNDSLTVPLSCDVAARIDDSEFKLGQLWAVHREDGSSYSGRQQEGRLDSLAPDTMYLDIILTPNPSHIESRPEVKEIWGETITLPGISIERLDLEADTR